MKKTRFFYGLNYFLIVLLGWLLLFGKAAEMNKRSEESAKREQKEKKKETDENKVQQREPSIRVLLTDSSWQSCYHQSVTIEQKGKEHTYTPDSRELQNDSLLLDGGTDGIAIPSIERAQNPPVYYGTLEIKKTAQGLLIINELSLEAVVPSEMPASYEEQALMAQAVCARTYAVCQIQENSLEKYGADVDDSVNYRFTTILGQIKEQIKQYRIQKVRSYARMENRSRLIIFLHQQAGQAQMRYGEQTGQQLI